MDGQTSLLEWKWWSRDYGDAAERRNAEGARCVIIFARAEGGLEECGKECGKDFEVAWRVPGNNA